MNTGSRFTPRLLLLIALGSSLALTVRAADPEPPAPVTHVLLTRPQLDELLGPIALYPDALIALILPASTVPTEVVLAARYLDAKGDPAAIDNQSWSDSVKALARYPEVIKWMDENLQWTNQLGESFLDQPAEVMNAVQRLRAMARATGALVDTPQQQVVVDGDTIEILPTQNDVIYVPRYDPEIVYVTRPGYYSTGPYLTFGVGFPIGVWLDYDFDWRRRVIWVGDRHRDWRDHRDWRRQYPPSQPNYPNNPNWHPWRPPANRPPLPRNTHRYRPEIERPRPLPGTPVNPRPPGWENRPGRDQRPPGAGDNNRPPRQDRGDRPPRTEGDNRPPTQGGMPPGPRPDGNGRPPRQENPNRPPPPNIAPPPVPAPVRAPAPNPVPAPVRPPAEVRQPAPQQRQGPPPQNQFPGNRPQPQFNPPPQPRAQPPPPPPPAPRDRPPETQEKQN